MTAARGHEVEARECGPLFHRDLCRVLRLPENASLDDQMTRAQALAASLADLLREVEGGFIGELDYHRIKRVLATAKAALTPPQAAP